MNTPTRRLPACRLSQCTRARTASAATLSRVLLTLTAMWIWQPSAAGDPAGRPDLSAAFDRILEEERLKRERAEADRQRQQLFLAALRIQEKQQEAAKNERGLVEAQKARLERTVSLQNWALGSFESSSRETGYQYPQLAPRLHALEKIHDQWKHVFCNQPAESKGAIVSGRAMNFFLELCGSVAVDQSLCRDQCRTERETLEALSERLAKRPAPADAKERESLEQERADCRRSLAEIRAKQEVLAQLGGKPLLRREEVRHLRFQKGVLGPKLIISASGDPLPLEWPSVLLENSECQPALRAMESAKNQAIRELSEGNGITAQTQKQLLEAADEIHWHYRQDWCRTCLPPPDAVTFSRYIQAKHFVQGLRMGVARFVEAKQVRDVTFDQPFVDLASDSPGEDAIVRPVEDLLVYMVQRGLRFAPADVNGEDAYRRTYELLVDYYGSLYRLHLLIQQEKEQVAALDKRSEKLMEIQYRDNLESLAKAIRAANERDAFAKARDAAVVFQASGGQKFMEGFFASFFGSPGTAGDQGPANAGARGGAGFQQGDRVCNRGILRWWSGTVMAVDGERYRVRIDYSANGQYRRGETYDFLAGELKPHTSVSVHELLH